MEEKEENFKSLVEWELLEERGEYSHDKELLVWIIGSASTIFAILVETYIFAVLLIIATGTFIVLGRKKEKKQLFSITSAGMFLESDFLSCECIQSFNIIDDPGARARLILEVEKLITVHEIVPIYDTNINQIEEIFKKLKIKKNETLELNILDKFASIL